MLFTTAVFILLFLPITLAGFYLARSRQVAVAWLLLASLVFYGWWKPVFVLLLLASIAGNFAVGTRIAAGAGRPAGKRWLVGGITADLALLGYFKYCNFFVDNLSALTGLPLQIAHVGLPIGVSFFTFTQIAFLVDAWQGKVREYSLVHYGLFVSYFPHLIAGPVLHHGQMMPQFADPATCRPNGGHLAAGLVIFALGLFKKVVLADGISPYADAVFNAADAGGAPATAEAWLGAVAYTLQLYFDFSGYSDMAIGLSWLFNIRLPFNFDSPYRATDISAFWRRWHMTLSQFLRDYLYIPLGGNRRGRWRQQANLMTTMLLGGLWHGAGWTFVVWGGLHGMYLVAHHAWRSALGARAGALSGSRAYVVIAWALTLLATIVAWVVFRAASLTGAGRMLGSMTGTTADADSPALWNAGLHLWTGGGLCALLALVALWPVNSNRIGRRALDICRARHSWRIAVAAAAATVVLMLMLLNLARDAASAFIYFNF